MGYTPFVDATFKCKQRENHYLKYGNSVDNHEYSDDFS